MTASGKRVTALVDGDLLVYQASAAVERPIDWGGGLWTLHSFLDEAIDHFSEAVNVIINAVSKRYNAPVKTVFALSDPDHNFRKELWPDYKANRKNKRPPLCRRALHSYVQTSHSTRTYPGLEADDVLGILMTGRGDSHDGIPGKKVLVSLDKDFYTIPGDHYNYVKEQFFRVDAKAADYAFMVQTLTGDGADGYPGCPGVGPVKAEKILNGFNGLEEMWPAVVDAYARAGQTEYQALTMARMARICRHGDYDFSKGEVKLWAPPSLTQI